MKVFETKEYGKLNKKIVFLLTGWQLKLSSLLILAKILEKNGYYCICYAYDNSILSPDVNKTVTNVLLVKDDILGKIADFKKSGFTDFSIAASSFGTIMALLVANESKDIKKIALNTTGADPAATVWSWDTVYPNFKKTLIENGFTLKKLQEVWRPIIPLYHMDNFKDKKILVYLSKKDKAIPYPLGMQLIHEFEKRKYHYQLITNTRLGHIGTAIYNGLNFRVYLNFLNQDS